MSSLSLLVGTTVWANTIIHKKSLQASMFFSFQVLSSKTNVQTACDPHDLNMYLSVTLILTELFQHNLIKVSYLTACYLYQVMNLMTLHFLNDVANDAESTQTSEITS